MPTATWRNLGPERRERVLQAAMREFGRAGFSAGSLNVIAREAGVAKGSLFQYFDGKLDLFATVADETSERIRGTLEPALLDLDPARPFWDWLADALGAWVGYFAGHPVERGVTAAVNLEIDPEVREAVRHVAHRHYTEVLGPLLTAAQQRGDIDPDADLPLLLASLLLWLPHLALAPHVPGLDPVLELHGRDPADIAPASTRIVRTLEQAFGTSRERLQ